MKKNYTRIISAVLAIVMVMLMIPAGTITISATKNFESYEELGFLGRSFNVLAGNELNQATLGMSVFDPKKIAGFLIGEVDKDLTDTLSNYAYISDINQYFKNQSWGLSVKQEADISLNAKSFAISTKLTRNIGFSKKSSSSSENANEYAYFTVWAPRKHYTLDCTRDGHVDHSVIVSALSERFLKELKTSSAYNLFQKYGTHIIIGYNAGGEALISYKSNSYSNISEKEFNHDSDIWGFKKDYAQKEIEAMASSGTYIDSKVYGGRGFVPKSKDDFMDGINSWVESLSDENAALAILTDDNLELLPIWELLEGDEWAARRSELATYYLQNLSEEYAKLYEDYIYDGSASTLPPDTTSSTYSDYTIISTPEQFDAIRNNMSGKYILACDIDLRNRSFTCIGSEAEPFTGVIDCMKHKVIYDGGNYCYPKTDNTVKNEISAIKNYEPVLSKKVLDDTGSKPVRWGANNYTAFGSYAAYYDELDLSDLYQYFNSDYIITFDFSIDYHTQTAIQKDCFAEMYFYDRKAKFETTESGGYEHKTKTNGQRAIDNGLVKTIDGGETLEYLADKGTYAAFSNLNNGYGYVNGDKYSAKFRVSGENCKKTMYFQYDSWGYGSNNAKTWYREGIIVNVTVTKKNTSEMPQTGLFVSDIAQTEYISGDLFDKNVLGGLYFVSPVTGERRNISIMDCRVSYNLTNNEENNQIKFVKVSYQEGVGDNAQIHNTYIPITVIPQKVEHLELDSSSKLNYYISDSFDKNLISVRVVMNNGLEMCVCGNQLTFIDFPSESDMKTAGAKTVTVQYGGQTLLFDISVEDVVCERIEISNMPDKRTYLQGESLDLRGVKIQKVMNDGSVVEISTDDEALKFDYDFSAGGTATVTVKYQGHTATFDVEVIGLDSIKITKQPDKLIYRSGETLSLEGMEVTAYYSDGTERVITDYTVNVAVLEDEGEQNILIEYEGKYTYLSVNVSNEVDEDAPQLIIGKARGLAGGYVTVEFVLKNVEAVKSMILYNFTYDSSVLELQSDSEGWTVDGALLADWNPTKMEAALLLNSNADINGVVFSLKFRILDDAALGNYAIGCSVAAKAKPVNEAEKAVAIAVVNGSVEVASIARGDVNGDDIIDSDDVIYLLKYTLLPDIYPINQSGDMDGNGTVDSDDVIYLLKYTLLPDIYPLH